MRNKKIKKELYDKIRVSGVIGLAVALMVLEDKKQERMESKKRKDKRFVKSVDKLFNEMIKSND